MYIFVPDKAHGFYQSAIDVDLNSGLLRKRYYFWIIPIKHKVLQTDFSRMANEYIEITDKPVWKEDYTGVSILLAKRSSGGRLQYICYKFSYLVEIFDEDGWDGYGLREEDRKDYFIKALGYLRENNIRALEDLTEELSKKTREY
jgi:hypothetical protein